MHIEAYQGAQWAVTASELTERVHDLGDSHVRAIDLGGADVNGSARPTITNPLVARGLYVDWLGVDVQAGPGVDVVLDLTQAMPEPMRGEFAVALCTEVLEHVAAWGLILAAAYQLLAPGGVLILTAASIGRRPHGARGELNPGPDEWYRNVEVTEVINNLIAIGFRYHGTRYNPNPGDVYSWAVK